MEAPEAHGPAGHLLTAAPSPALAIFAAGLAPRPARGRSTHGYQRAEILSAQANGLTLHGRPTPHRATP